MHYFLLKDGYTALHLAVEFCKPQSVQLLLGYGAQVEAKGGKVSKEIKEKSPEMSVI